MVQVKESVGTEQKGSMKAVSGSGMASMSEASMDFQPRMEEPSKPKPSAKTSSFSSAMGQLKCCQVPKVSTNLMSTILAPLFLASSNTLLGVLMLCLVVRCFRFQKLSRAPRKFFHRPNPPAEAHAKWSLSALVVAFLAV